ncbi:response regulator [Agarilytica rhodophyticola]|uniref:response regulator n=1 Tax=Agarilytica rhodophyticola TaxID=1737490 RepID=UPI000B343F62|nr:response regulator [Agarilytica rhodophyticola]
MSTKEHILLVEDDASLSEWMSDYLNGHGYLVTVANRGDAAVELIESDVPDIVVLDVMLPEKNGFDVCREVRNFFARPILMLTACTEEADEVLGLELGADDYLTKPVKPRVLLARIKALLRRAPEVTPKSMRSFGALSIDAQSKTASLNGEMVGLSSNEFDVLWLLACNAGKVVSRTELVSQLRGIDYDGFDRSIDIRISRLRKKLLDDSNQPFKIKTVWGKGYLFAPDAW